MYSPVWISLKTALVATAITFCLGVSAAWQMAKYRGKIKSLIDAILTAPLILPPTVLGFLLLLVFGRNGLIGRLLDSFGIQVVFTWYATVIAAVVVSFPLMYKTALGAFQQTYSGNLIGCARTLGASETTIFWRIILPLAKPGLIVGILLAFARAMGEFGATLILAGSIPGKTQTIPIAIFFAAESGAMDEALKLVVILLVICLSIISGANYWQDVGQWSNGNNRERVKGRAGNRAIKLPKDSEIWLEVNIQKQLPEFLLDVNFTIDRQQNPLGILGASGAGKSTLLRCIAGLETPDRGRIVFNHRILYDSAKRINLPPQERDVGLLFQDYALFPHLSVAENIAFGMSAKRSALAVREEVNRQLELVNLSQMGHYLTHQLSGGEKQRVALTRVLASQPKITLLDEPFSALDSNLKEELIALLHQRINNYAGLTLYVTHNLSQAYQLCPQLLIIDRGKAIAFDDRQNLINHPLNLPTAKIVGYRNFSTVSKIAPQTVRALDWQCDLKCDRPVSDRIEHVAIDSYAVNFVDHSKGVNVFPVWLVNRLELPNRVILYLKFNLATDNSSQHLEVDLSHNQWSKLTSRTFPWYIQLPPSKIVLLEQNSSF